MRFSLPIVALAAIGAQAIPQSVQPISQISDGQIQAPPATATGPAGSPSAPAPVVPNPTTAAPVAPTTAPTLGAPIPTTTATTGPAAPLIPSVGTGSSAAPTNGTVSTGSPNPTSGSPSTPSGSGAPQQSGNSAAANGITFGGFALAVFAMLA